jgi:FkbM family methyltransferase
VDYINDYSERFGLSARDRRRLLLSYPLIRVAARGRQGPAREIPHTIMGTFPAALPLAPHDFSSFAEIFFQDEYRLDTEIRSFVDLGANIGMASLYFCTKGATRGIAVEANPTLISQLQGRLANCPVAIENAAVTGRDDPAGACFGVASNHRLSAIATDGVRVPAVCLETLLDRHGIEHADLLKMDIEGAEFDVLATGRDALRRFDRLFVEIHGDRREEFKHGLRDCGFTTEDRGASAESLTVYAHR